MPPQDSDTARWFSEEVQPHEASLRSYLRNRFPAHPDVDDLVQETYARLLQARERRMVQKPRSFIFAIARNFALDFFRRRRVAAIDATDELETLPICDERPGLPETVCHDEELGVLADAIRALPSRCRHVVTLRKIHGMSHKEIADRLGISSNTVNAQVAIGVLRLRDYLKSRGVTGGIGT